MPDTATLSAAQQLAISSLISLTCAYISYRASKSNSQEENIRQQVLLICAKIDQHADRAIDYWLTRQNKEADTRNEARMKIARIEIGLDISSLSGYIKDRSVSCNEDIIAFSQAMTDGDFETGKKKISPERCERITRAKTALIQKLKARHGIV